MAKLIAKNDYLVKEILQSPKHHVRAAGDCWIFNRPTGEWRRWDRPCNGKRSKYRSVSYKNKDVLVHRLVFSLANQLSPDLVINHIDGNPANNQITNLELVTHSENMFHKFRVLKAKPTGYRKISKEIADQIRYLRTCGFKYRELMDKFGLCKSTISYVVNSRTCKDIPG
jgi:hypothetical protein